MGVRFRQNDADGASSGRGLGTEGEGAAERKECGGCVASQVHMFGFSGWRKHTLGTQAPYHYFDNVTGVTNVHSFDLQLRVYRRLADRYNITLH